MRNIDILHVKDNQFHICSVCEVCCADLIISYFNPDKTWHVRLQHPNAQVIKMCRSCLGLFRAELKAEFKIMEARYAQMKKDRL